MNDFDVAINRTGEIIKLACQGEGASGLMEKFRSAASGYSQEDMHRIQFTLLECAYLYQQWEESFLKIKDEVFVHVFDGETQPTQQKE